MSTQAEIFEAIRAGDHVRLQKLLAEDPSLAAARDESGVSALMQALYQFRRKMVDSLLAAKPKLDVFEAAALGEQEHLAHLIDADPKLVNAVSADGFTALHFAAFFGQLNTAELLLRHGADMHAVSKNSMAVMPLQSAAARGQRALVESLLRHGAHVNARQGGGYTPLHSAANLGDPTLVKLLLDHGANPSLANDDGKTPLDLATANGHKEVIKLLG